MAISMYDEHDRERREKCHADYIADPNFAEIEGEARSRGFRKATIDEIHASAESLPFAAELFCWKGGLWAKLQEA